MNRTLEGMNALRKAGWTPRRSNGRNRLWMSPDGRVVAEWAALVELKGGRIGGESYRKPIVKALGRRRTEVKA